MSTRHPDDLAASPAPVFDLNDGSRPTMVRFGVLGYMAALAFVMYLDRVCISVAAKDMQDELGISKTMWGYVGSSFTVAYTLFEVITGHWGDRYGSRGILLRIVLWWSAFTILTGCVWKIGPSGTGAWLQGVNLTFVLLCLIRFLFGVGEAGAFPNVARVVSVWFPPAVRGRAQGFVTTCSLIGGATAPVVATWIIAATGSWRMMFVVFGLVGCVWALAFYVWYRDNPATHPAVNDAERWLIAQGRVPHTESHHNVPWNLVLPSANLWLMGGIMGCGSAVFYMLISWYPNYLEEAHGLEKPWPGVFMTLVMTAGAIGCFSGGWLSDWLIRVTGERVLSRRLQACLAYVGAGTALVLAVRLHDYRLSVLCIALAYFFVQLQIPCWWGVVTDISGAHVGALFGLMNSLGAVGAITSPIFMGYYVDHLKRTGAVGRAQWDPAFYTYAGIMFLACVLWMFVNPARSLVTRARVSKDVEGV